jgi:lipoprotein NlpI
VDCFSKAVALSPTYSFAAANKALATYQVGNKEDAIR